MDKLGNIFKFHIKWRDIIGKIHQRNEKNSKNPQKKMKKIQNVNSPKSGIELDGSSECPLIFGGGGGGGLID